MTGQLPAVPNSARLMPVVLPLTQDHLVAHKRSTSGIWDEDFAFSPGEHSEPFEPGDAWDEGPQHGSTLPGGSLPLFPGRLEAETLEWDFLETFCGSHG